MYKLFSYPTHLDTWYYPPTDSLLYSHTGIHHPDCCRCAHRETPHTHCSLKKIKAVKVFVCSLNHACVYRKTMTSQDYDISHKKSVTPTSFNTLLSSTYCSSRTLTYIATHSIYTEHSRVTKISLVYSSHQALIDI